MAEAHATEWLLSDHAGFWATSVSPLKKTLTRKTEAMCASLPSPAQPICEVEGRGILSLPTSPGPLDLFRDHNSVCSLDPGSRHPNTAPAPWLLWNVLPITTCRLASGPSLCDSEARGGRQGGLDPQALLSRPSAHPADFQHPAWCAPTRVAALEPPFYAPSQQGPPPPTSSGPQPMEGPESSRVPSASSST